MLATNANLENTYTENSEYIAIAIYIYFLLVIAYKPNICWFVLYEVEVALEENMKNC